MDERITIGIKMDLEKTETRISADPEAKTKVYVSQVLDEAEDGEFYAAMPIEEGKIIPLSVEQELIATFYTKNGLLRCTLVVTGRFKKGSLYLMKVKQLTDLQKVQRREYYRLECNRPLEYRVLGEKEKELLDNGLALEADKIALEWKKGVMLDLSGGGIRFVSPYKEEKDSHIQVRFEIEDGSEVRVLYSYAILLHTEKNQNNSSIYTHRIMFRRMDKKIREKLVRYIFNVQRMNRLKASGLE